MNIIENYSLRLLNTFGIDATARYFTAIESIDQGMEVLRSERFRSLPRLVLGGGSNILFRKDFGGIVLKNELKGIELVREDADHFYVKAGAGENWHLFVMHCIGQGYAGIENLSLIPGNVGASPMQNIGAYGVELKDVFHELEALNMQTLETETFSNADCRFGYRESIFKHEAKDRYMITSVTLRLNKKPVFNTSYGAIEKELEAMGVKDLSIRAISQAVINIRSSKLPDPAKIGNAGSFFKNPVVGMEKYESLKQQFPGIVAYRSSPTEMKLAAGWLIEQCGWKGQTYGDAGVHKMQALVIVNYGNAEGREIYNLSQRIMDSVFEKFGVELEREVNIV
jgi:UDP-N-acetylmuramate dehydrogenase